MTPEQIHDVAKAVVQSFLDDAMDAGLMDISEIADGRELTTPVDGDQEGWDEIRNRVAWLSGFLGGHLDTLEENA